MFPKNFIIEYNNNSIQIKHNPCMSVNYITSTSFYFCITGNFRIAFKKNTMYEINIVYNLDLKYTKKKYAHLWLWLYYMCVIVYVLKYLIKKIRRLIMKYWSILYIFFHLKFVVTSCCELIVYVNWLCVYLCLFICMYYLRVNYNN